jgi:chorismate synthase
MKMSLRFLTAGESHGSALVTILEGMPAGLPLSSEDIDKDLQRRQKGYGAGPRMKLENDYVEILSGVMAGQTIGSPVALLIKNLDHEKWRGKAVSPFTIPRPGHADLTAAVKYGYSDLRPSLERASARETAARVAVGAVCRRFLAEFGVLVGGYVRSIGEVQADLHAYPVQQRIEQALISEISCPDPQAEPAMRDRIRQAMEDRDTVGGEIEVVALNLPPGLGSHVHWDRKLEARICAAILSVPAIKGVEIGPAFENARLPGSQAQDSIQNRDGSLTRLSERCGGLEGGITTGQPLLVHAAMKPVATTLTTQQSVDLASGQNTSTQYERSDFCPVPRAVVILEAMLAYVLAEALLEKLGGDSISEMRPRFDGLRRARVDDLPMDNTPKVWWPE